ncbi:XRE family transcriptional regulator [Streptomyces sp. NPDC014733]|uniref:XRE family transcriptional regulator n=1 Tax=Streptomyces sp. NPDC014733 TaxID=3364885 RepID=UPI0036FED21B
MTEIDAPLPAGQELIKIGVNSGIVVRGDRNVIVQFPAEFSAKDALAGLVERLVPAVRAKERSVDSELTGRADLLADHVRMRLQNEVEQLRLLDRDLPVRWRLALGKASFREGIRNDPAGTTSTPSLDLTAVLQQADSRWLAVLGREGSGKSALALRFALAHLDARHSHPGQPAPVPVIFSLGSWDPGAISLRSWLIGRMERDHTFLAERDPGNKTWAEVLVSKKCVLPILDGFDEIAIGWREKALKELNSCLLPLIVTSRRAEIEAARKETKVVPYAIAVELADVTLDDAVTYLQNATDATLPDDTDSASRTGWAPVLRELRSRQHSPAGARLASVLTTPLMVTLARFVHESDLDPADLLDDETFGTREALEKHLLETFIPTAYERFLGEGSTRRRDPERAQQWLGYLAAHLTELGTPDIEWWRLGTTVRPRRLMLRVGVTVGVVCGLVAGLVYGAESLLLYGPLDGLMTAGVTGPANGLALGLTFALMHGFVSRMKVGGPAFEPSLMEIRLHGWTRNGTGKRLRESFCPRVMGGLAGGLLFGVLWALGGAAIAVFQRYPGPLIALNSAMLLAAGIGLGGVLGLIAALGAGFETAIPREESACPPDLLNTNRATVLTQLLTVGLVIGTGWGVLFGALSHSALDGIAAGLVAGSMTALGVGTMTAWGRWVVLAQIWLPLSGWLPRDLDAFLQDAWERNILRKVGAVYQFRHAQLREHLAATAGPPPDHVLHRVRSLDRLFDATDTDGDGYISEDDQLRIAERCRTAYGLDADSAEAKDLEHFHREYWAGLRRHAKTGGRLSRAQHRTAAGALATEPDPPLPVAAFGTAMFTVIDVDRAGSIGERELRRYLDIWDLGGDVSRVLGRLDGDGDGRLGADDLIRAIDAYIRSPHLGGAGSVFFGVA